MIILSINTKGNDWSLDFSKIKFSKTFVQIFSQSEQINNLVIKQEHFSSKKVNIVHMVVIQGNTYVLCKKRKTNF